MDGVAAARTPERTLVVREYEPADGRAVVDPLGLCFGAWPHGLDEVAPAEFFRWKTEQCPFGASRSWIAEVDGEIVGFLAQLPWRMQVANRVLTTLRGTDLAVHPRYRRRGVSQAMVRAAMRAQLPDVALAWNNPNALSRGSVLKAGRRRLLSVQRFIRPRARPWRTLARLAARGSCTPDAVEVAAPIPAEVLSDEPFVAQLLERSPRNHARLATERTVEYLRWRYAFDAYRAIRVGGTADDGGVAVFRVRRAGALWLAEVCEVIAPRAGTARELLCRVGAAAATDFSCCSFTSYAQALRFGFAVPAGQLELTVRRVRGEVGVDPSQSASWALSLGDVELL